jgi:hypothetical protein
MDRDDRISAEEKTHAEAPAQTGNVAAICDTLRD